MRRKPGFQRFNQVFMWQEKEMKDGNDEKWCRYFGCIGCMHQV